jgi:hypothetical protein
VYVICKCYAIYYFLQCWGLNLGHHTGKASTLELSCIPQLTMKGNLVSIDFGICRGVLELIPRGYRGTTLLVVKETPTFMMCLGPGPEQGTACFSM